MGRLHLGEFAGSNCNDYRYCMVFASNIINTDLGRMYVPVTGCNHKQNINVLSRIYYPLTATYNRIQSITGFYDNSYNSSTIMGLAGTQNVFIFRNFVFRRSDFKPLFGKYHLYNIKDDIATRTNKSVFIISPTLLNDVKNTKLKNFILSKLIPNAAGYSASIEVGEFSSTDFVPVAMNDNDKRLESCIKSSYLDIPGDDHDMYYSSGDNCIALLNELSYICKKESLDAIYSLLPNYCKPLHDSEMKSLSLPKINK